MDSLKIKGSSKKLVYICHNCGYTSPKWLGRCPGCEMWHTFVEEEVIVGAGVKADSVSLHESPQPIDRIEASEGERLVSGISELDRVLGGGIVPGSSVLVGGEPGIGKSTLLLQLLHRIALSGKRVIYISGEESAKQIKLRASRIGALSENLLVLVEINLDEIAKHIENVHPAVVVVDSIQTMYTPSLASVPGSVSQVRESAERLILLAKRTAIPMFLVGHVTKEGSIAGPKVLEHMVDAVLYFEGDGAHAYRIIRSVKNRYGPANEIGVFEMRERGLEEVTNPSAYFLAGRRSSVPGSVVVASGEGTRPLLVEIQSLVVPSTLGIPRRTAIGVDTNRVSLLVAVMERVLGMRIGGCDIYLNVAGGVRVTEPAVDLGIVSSLVSGFLDKPILPGTVVFGEVGLTGEVRRVGHVGARVREAGRLGFTVCVMPTMDSGEVRKECESHIDRIFEIDTLSKLVECLF
ncbi:MAG: DNA repair protein RadA [Syntrophales bacterium]|nr:DNA repair protein RadA [Syntrophales bacterium]